MFNSLRARYYLAVVGIATIPILLLGLFAGLRSASELERQSLILQRELAARVEGEIASFVLARRDELRLFERINTLVEMSAPQLLASVNRLLAHDQVYQELIILETGGNVRAFASRTDIAPRHPQDWSSAPFARRGYWDDEEEFIGPINYDEHLREPLIDIAVPVVERRSGAAAGALLARVRFRPIWNLLGDLELPAETDAFVINAKGHILAHRRPSEILSANVFEPPLQDGRLQLADGKAGLVAIHPLSLVGEPAFVVVTRPLQTALASANETRATTLVSAVLLLFAASLLALQQSRGIVRPVEALARTARRISGGDLDARIEVSGPQEIRALSQTLREMTDRLKYIIAKLKRSEMVERQRAMVTLESIGDAVITTDPEGAVTYINPAAAILTGWSFLEAKDQPATKVFQVVDEQSRAPASNPVALCLESGRAIDTTYGTVLLGRGGREYAIHSSAAPIREPGGEVLGVVMVFRDITERKLLEEKLRQSQKMEAIGQLTGGIAHDFNNILQVIQGNAELILDDADLPRDLTDPILKASKRGGELTERLLAFARKKHLTPKSNDIADLLAEMRPIFDRTLGEAIEVVLDIPSETWPAHADPGQLENAILNLALNSRDAMPRGGRLLIRCRNATKDDFKSQHMGDLVGTEFVSISVEDNGMGMTAETLKRAIEPFFTTKGVGEGSGLGLSMVYGFVLQTGGHLELESEEGVGTTVTMFLPRSRKAVEAADEDHSKKYSIGRAETILIVEDDVSVRTMLKRMLEVLKYRVVEAGNVAEASQVLEKSKPIDLVLTDIGLPNGISGLDFARMLAKSHPDLPVACMSGYPDALSAEDDLIASGTLLIRKPFRRDELASILRRLLVRPGL